MPHCLKELNKLYDILARETGHFSLACKERCPDCCTVNVTATSLETAFIFNLLEESEIRQMVRRLKDRFPGQRYVPKATANGFARACMEGRDLPHEENDPQWGACPLLEDGRCTIYRARPLGCRVMMSEEPCRQSGFARMPPFALTLSNLLNQAVEAADEKGVTGNFFDLLAAYALAWESCSRPKGLYLSLDNIANSDKKEVFLRNQPIPVLMVPPEHREQALPLIREIRAQGGSGAD